MAIVSKKTIIIAACALICLITAGYIIVPKGVTAVEVSDDKGAVTDTIQVYLGCDDNLSWAIKPEQFDGRNVEFEIADPSIADISADGKLSGVKTGDTILVVSALNYRDKIDVSVLPSVTDIQGIKSNIEMTEGDTRDLNVKLKVADESIDKKTIDVTYKSDKSSIAKIDEKGNLTAVKAGKAKITIKAGGFSKTVNVTVASKPVYVAPQTNTGGGNSNSSSSSSHSGGNNSGGGGNSGGSSSGGGSPEGGWE